MSEGELITEPAPTHMSLFSKDGFELTQRMAMAYAKSTLVPKEYQNNPGNCIIALNMAQRIGADPLMAMQNLYIVHGHPAWSSQFLIATFNSCGKYSSIRYEWNEKKGDDWGCSAVAIELATGELLRGTEVTIKLAKDEGWYTKSGSKWKTMPEQMLRYRAASWLVRAYAPEIAMGLHTVDELDDVHGPRPGITNVNTKVSSVDVSDYFTPAGEPKTEPASGELFGE